ncbi:serine hydrolase [Lactiplantibacillus mudanjiangensis]|uniref:Beta-lactamase class C and other penicillin binding proteins [Lactobacillus zymae] n=1 Tax=Lactiplantibacillus mudanjiangensis TaxID=1296538 RepID=A0A660E2E6_9LACO|nr:serine hydrolase [Lactiplantibacillus mudanjiangensis]VDG23567.1 Beta-lactamase class C and other penicillin binding proteins [Lactobacillus zymae] [Lactiplantibacillus mudanjiangensis]VDG28800.1 Beta-lactamase class C and other penicillin binding proteins [Lactobacillus zymae] [Lactiplantibacillus mudanjiangensis]VDG32186.1 Beta-lactamase class C and other penicillin binding proteins [Lactobacillus zymae] [Lactiplantibacillus mudanjiangensis]
MKKLATLLGTVGTLAAVGLFMPTTAHAYDTISKQTNQNYTARFVNQAKTNDGIYKYGIYNTSSSTATRDLNGKNWEHRFIKVTQEATTASGTWVKFSYYGDTIGWVKKSAIEPYSVKQNAIALIDKYHYRGTAMLIKNYASNSVTASTGYAYYGGRKLNTSDTVYPTASLQKVITGAIIVQLVNEHKLTQYTRLSKFYPNIKTSADITIRQLLDHNTGLEQTNEEIDPGKNLTEAQAIQYAISQLNATGAGKHHYTNANYILLAGIIRQLTGQSLEANVQSRIINKLGLKETYFYNTIPSNITPAASYKYENGKNYQYYALTTNLLSSLTGAGNMYMSPQDYYTVQKGLRNGKILNKSDYYYLSNNYKYAYDGGMWHNKSTHMKYSSGSLRNTGITTHMYLSEGNKTGVIFFSNQKGTGRSTADLTEKTLYNLVKYYM